MSFGSSEDDRFDYQHEVGLIPSVKEGVEEDEYVPPPFTFGDWVGYIGIRLLAVMVVIGSITLASMHGRNVEKSPTTSPTTSVSP